MTKLTIMLTIATLMTSTNVAAVAPVPQLDDNGNASFVRQVIPKLLGRKPKGTEEVNLLKDITDLHGREAMVRILMEQDEFVDHWAATMTDQLQMQRESGRAQSTACFADETPTNFGVAWEANNIPENKGHLAQFVRDNSISATYGKSFNMVDLIKSSIHLDNLMPIYRGYLYPLGNQRGAYGGMQSADEIAAGVGTAFDEAYLNRNLECMSCHRGTYSTTGVGVRTHPLYKTLDLAMYDHIGLGEIKVIENKTYTDHCDDCHGPTAEGVGEINGIRDWSATNITSILQNPPPGMPNFEDLLNSPGDIDALADALNGAFGQAKIEQTTSKHFGAFRGDYFAIDDRDTEGIDEGDPSLGDGPWGMNTECASIVNQPFLGAKPAFFAGHVSDDATVVVIDEKLVEGYQYLDSAGSNLKALDNAESIPGGAAFAYMVAAKITENTWEQLMGEPLTIVNKFARNNMQKEMHRYLIEDVFIAHDWSLKEVIVAILGTRFFNRQAPVSSLASGPYILPAIFDPFVPADADCIVNREPDGGGKIDDITSTKDTGRITHSDTFTSGEDCAYNGQGELVHRYSPRNLLNSVSAALNWPEPKIFPSTNNYPSMPFNKAIGQYVSEFDKGDKDIGFQALLNWDGQYGTCETPSNIATSDGYDWINKFRGQIDEFNAKNPQQLLTLGEVVLSLKDWLLQEPVFGGYRNESDDTLDRADSYATKDDGPDNPEFGFANKVDTDGAAEEFTEAELVVNLFGMALDTNVDTQAIPENTLRELCGVYVKAPQFMLSGIVRNDIFDAPRFRVCNDEACSYKQMCTVYSEAASGLGFAMVCNSNSISEPLDEALAVSVSNDDEPEGTIGVFEAIFNVLSGFRD